MNGAPRWTWTVDWNIILTDQWPKDEIGKKISISCSVWQCGEYLDFQIFPQTQTNISHSVQFLLTQSGAISQQVFSVQPSKNWSTGIFCIDQTEYHNIYFLYISRSFSKKMSPSGWSALGVWKEYHNIYFLYIFRSFSKNKSPSRWSALGGWQA